jgi:hypothetical protein
VLVPDGPEYERSSKLFRTTLELNDGVDMGHLFEGRQPFGKVPARSVHACAATLLVGDLCLAARFAC